MITSRYETKLIHGSYDGESSIAPTVDFDSDAGYSEGFTLLVTDGTDYICTDATVGAAVWTLNDKYDIALTLRIIQITEMLFDYLNNPFFGNRSTDNVVLSDLIFLDNLVTSVGDFILDDGTARYYTGDNIRLVGSIRNDNFYDIASATDDSITLDRNVSINLTDPSSVNIILVSWPEGLSAIAARMVAYDVYSRGSGSDKKSESIGTYSYSTEDTDVNGISYPASVVSGIMVYKVPKYV